MPLSGDPCATIFGCYIPVEFCLLRRPPERTYMSPMKSIPAEIIANAHSRGTSREMLNAPPQIPRPPPPARPSVVPSAADRVKYDAEADDARRTPGCGDWLICAASVSLGFVALTATESAGLFTFSELSFISNRGREKCM